MKHVVGSILNLSNTGGGGRGTDEGDIVGSVILHGKLFTNENTVRNFLLIMYHIFAQERRSTGCVGEIITIIWVWRPEKTL